MGGVLELYTYKRNRVRKDMVQGQRKGKEEDLRHIQSLTIEGRHRIIEAPPVKRKSTEKSKQEPRTIKEEVVKGTRSREMKKKKKKKGKAKQKTP